MTQTEQFTIRATEAEMIAQMIRFGEGAAQVCQIEPRPVWVVSIEINEKVEILATFESQTAAVEAAEALDRSMRAEVGTGGQGLKLATVNGETLQ